MEKINITKINSVLYLVDGQLLHASEDFISLNPLISPAIIMKDEASSPKVCVTRFTMDKAEFAVLQVHYGPLSGFPNGGVPLFPGYASAMSMAATDLAAIQPRTATDVQGDDALLLTHSLTADGFPESGETTKGEERLLWFRSLKPVQSKKWGTILYPTKSESSAFNPNAPLVAHGLSCRYHFEVVSTALFDL